MTSAFCPSHVTCFFKPYVSGGVLERGSAGAGIRLGAGTTVHVCEVSGRTRVSINGEEDEARVTRHVLESMAPGRGFEVDAECALPLGQGFGTSASGAVAAALCASEIVGKGREEAFEAAHAAEVVCGGGLGDVAGLMHEWHAPLRIFAGMPPTGRVVNGGISFERVTLAVLGGRVSTAGVLGDEARMGRICAAGATAMNMFAEHRTKDRLFEASGRFSSEAGLRGPEVAAAMHALDGAGIRSLMCMLGNSILAEAGEDEVRGVLGDGCLLASTSSTAEPARVTRKA
ncbi:MAG: pantothenate kinase [Methanomassiliicoccaceae archaeon]|nr:pantothenate kinase [Methanomassiliicoccaceae archaeon]